MVWGLRTILEQVSQVPLLSEGVVEDTIVIITRGLAEMTRIGTAYGADPLTFLGLAGVGDLFMTCSSPTSRNYSVGFRLGKGESLDSIIDSLGSIAEGVTTAKGVKMILDELGIKARIATTVSFLSTRLQIVFDELYRSTKFYMKVSLVHSLAYVWCIINPSQGKTYRLRFENFWNYRYLKR